MKMKYCLGNDKSKFKRNIVALFALLPLMVGFRQAPFSWIKLVNNTEKYPIIRLSCDPLQNQIFYASSKSVYKINLENNSTQLIFYTDDFINDFYISENKKALIATDGGLYETTLDGNNIEKVFHSNTNQKCMSILEYESKIFLGTQKGIYFKDDKSSWIKITGNFLNDPITRIKKHEKHIYITTDEYLYSISLTDLTSKTLFRSNYNPFNKDINDLDTETIISNDEITEPDKNGIKDFDVRPTTMLVSTIDGIFISKNNGISWDPLPVDSLPLEKLTSISMINDTNNLEIIAGTKEGCFLFKDGNWLSLYQGIISADIKDLNITITNDLIAATEDGIYKLIMNKNPNLNHDFDLDTVKNKFNKEPDIRQLQKLAIQYADVHPSKISKWREDAEKKAWLPKLSVGIDVERDRTISDNIWGTYTNGGQCFYGPDDKTNYRNSNWGATLSWDFSELLWNPDQTSIDSRAKLTTEQREDLLIQLTRIYFERRRLQIEMLSSHDDTEPSEYLINQIRVDELTALLDAMTGGSFSEQLKNNNP